MAKPTILKERGTGEELYPRTLASLVQTSLGENVDEGLKKADTKAFDLQWEAIGGTVTTPGEVYEINGGMGNFSDAVKAMSYYTEQPRADLSKLCFSKSLKLLPTIIIPSATNIIFANTFQSFYGIKKVVIKSTLNQGDVYVGNLFAAFNSSQVEELDCTLNVTNAKMVTEAFVYCKIREVRLKGLKSNISFHYSNILSLASLQYLVANAANTTAITVTVHADVYAKLTGDTTNAAVAALTGEELAAWQQVLADAVAKNISFATT